MRNIRIPDLYRRLDLVLARVPVPALLDLVPAPRPTPKPAPVPLTTRQEIRKEMAQLAMGGRVALRLWEQAQANIRYDRSPILGRPFPRFDSTGIPYALTL